MSCDDSIEIVIEPTKGLWRIPVREVWEYRDLLLLLVRRDFVSKFKQTVLGPLWFIVQPVLMTVVFTIVFGKVAKIPTDGLPGVLFYLCGMMAWGYFAQCMQGTSATFLANAHIFGKVYFPRLVVPLAVTVSNLFAFGIQLATFLGFWLFFKFFTDAADSFGLRATVVLLPLLVLHTAAVGLGVGLWMSALTAKYRDFSHLAGFLTQLWMYATPVVYPLSEVPERWQWVSSMNPMTAVVELYRYSFLGVGTVTPVSIGVSVGAGLVLLVTGLLAFGKVEKTFIDTV